MHRYSRRAALGALCAGAVSLAGCLEDDDNDDTENGQNGSEDLQQEWEENDDYPGDEFRNHEVEQMGISIMDLDGEEEVETTAGYHLHFIQAGVMPNYIESPSVEVKIEASDSIDIYMIPGAVDLDAYDRTEGESIDPNNYSRSAEYSAFAVTEYNETLRLDDDESKYTMVVTLEDHIPPQSNEELIEFVEEKEEIILEGHTEISGYIPFEEFEQNDQAQRAHRDNI